MQAQTSKTFASDNFTLSAYLLSGGCKLISVDKTNPKRVIFVFEETDLRLGLTEEFLSHQAKVEPHSFSAAQKDLKQMIYQKNPEVKDDV